jgi:anaerobic magnesium-protoporphyrin IX monomethyl ester cyclase
MALRDYHPDIVGAYCMISLTRNTFRLARWVRTELPDSLLVAGGPLPTLYPERFASDFDAIFRGESDLSFPHFCQDFFLPGWNPFHAGKTSAPNL